MLLITAHPLIGRGREEPDNETEHLEYEIIIHLFKLGYYSTSSGFFFLVNGIPMTYNLQTFSPQH